MKPSVDQLVLQTPKGVSAPGFPSNKTSFIQKNFQQSTIERQEIVVHRKANKPLLIFAVQIVILILINSQTKNDMICLLLNEFVIFLN